MAACSSHWQCPTGQRCAASGTDAALCVPGRPAHHFEDDADRACASGKRGHMNLAVDRDWRGDGAPRLMQRCCPGPTLNASVMDSERFAGLTGDHRFCAGLPRGDPCTVDAQCAGADLCVGAGRPSAACGPRRGEGEPVAHAAECGSHTRAGYWSPADEAAQVLRCCPAGSTYDARGRCNNLPWPQGQPALTDRAGVRTLDFFGNTAVFAEGYRDQLGAFNDRVKAVEVAPGCTVRLYEHRGGGQWSDLLPGKYTSTGRWGDGGEFDKGVASMRVDCGGAPAAPLPAGGGVRVHTADGKATVLPTGDHLNLGEFNDRIERVDVAEGCRAELHQHGTLSGEKGTLSQPGTHLGKRRYGEGMFRTSDVTSLRVACSGGAAAVLNQAGAGETEVSPGFYQHLDSVGLSDQISSVLVKAGCSVRLYDHDNAKGASGDLVAGAADRLFHGVGSGSWGNGRFRANKATSMIVACGEPLPPANCKGVGFYANLAGPGPCCTGKSAPDEDGDQECIL